MKVIHCDHCKVKIENTKNDYVNSYINFAYDKCSPEYPNDMLRLVLDLCLTCAKRLEQLLLILQEEKPHLKKKLNNKELLREDE